jgi:hypothetical protein
MVGRSCRLSGLLAGDAAASAVQFMSKRDVGVGIDIDLSESIFRSVIPQRKAASRMQSNTKTTAFVLCLLRKTFWDLNCDIAPKLKVYTALAQLQGVCCFRAMKIQLINGL